MKKFGLGLIGCGGMGRSLATNANQIKQVKARPQLVSETTLTWGSSTGPTESVNPSLDREGADAEYSDDEYDVGVVAVSDLDISLAKSLASDISAEFTDDYLDLLVDDRIDAILIATPPFLHADIAVDAAAAGKHIFTEKPMATTLIDCDRMIRSAESHGVQLGVGLVCRFHAVHSTIRQLVHSGTYGRPISMKVHRTGGPWSGEPSHWRMKRDQCGGFLMEVNAHEIDFMRWTLGVGTEDRVSSVHASGGIYLQPHTDYADLVFLTMRFTNGAIGFLHAGQVSALGGYGGAVDCEKGSLHFPTIWGENSQIQIHTFDGQTETIPATEIAVDSPVKAEIQAFIEAILQGQLPPVTGTDGRAATEIALAAYQSIRTGQVVNLPL